MTYYKISTYFIKMSLTNAKTISNTQVGAINSAIDLSANSLTLANNLNCKNAVISGSTIYLGPYGTLINASTDVVLRNINSTGSLVLQSNNGSFSTYLDVSGTLNTSGNMSCGGSISTPNVLIPSNGTGSVFFTSNSSAFTTNSSGRLFGLTNTMFIDYPGTLQFRSFTSNNSNNVTSTSSINASGTYIGSDQTIKNTIEPLNTLHSLERVLGIIPYSFKYNHDDLNRDCVGFISQQVQTIDPYCVVETPYREIESIDESGNTIKETESKLFMNYQDIFVHCVGAIQELNNKIDLLQARITILEG